MVVHQGGNDGSVAAVIGVNKGAEKAVTVKVMPQNMTASSTSDATLMLHYDRGQMGVFEYPGVDEPVMANGSPVSLPVNLSGMFNISLEAGL